MAGDDVHHINEVTLGRAKLVLGLETTFGESIIPVFIQSTQPGHPSVSAMSTRDGFGHLWGRNGEFCVVVSPATRTAGMHASVSRRHWLLIRASHPADNGWV